MTVVFQEAEPELLDLRIGRVNLHAVDLAAANRRVGELVLHPSHAVHLEAVGPGQARPTVRPLDELLREPEA